MYLSANYSFSTTDSSVDEIMPMVQVKVPRNDVRSTDTLTSAPKRAVFLIKLSKLTSGLNWHFSDVAFDNALLVFTKAAKAKLKPLVIDNLEDDQGIFLDFTQPNAYYAFELYNDGEIIVTKKLGDQDSMVSTINSVESITF